MKNKKFKRSICLTAVAVTLLVSLTVGTAMAYFTTYATAEGGVQMELDFTKTDIDENVVDGKKEIKVTNTGDFSCYVRVKALAGDAHTLAYEEPVADGASSKWTPNPDGYYYYADVLEPGASTTLLNVLFELPTDADEPADFNVIIIQENTPVLYGEDGTPYANWSKVADVNQTEYK